MPDTAGICEFDPFRRVVQRRRYNAAIARIGNCRPILYRIGGAYCSSLVLSHLNESWQVIPGTTRDVPRALLPGWMSYEDPRYFEHQGQLWCSVTLYTREQGEGLSRIAIGPCDVSGMPLALRIIDFPEQNIVDKNWIFFDDVDGRLWCSYSIWCGHHVVLPVREDFSLSAADAVITEHATPWSAAEWGEPRGGTNFIPRHGAGGSCLVQFFHTQLRFEVHDGTALQYHVGAVAIEPRAPFRCIGLSRAPVIELPEQMPQRAEGTRIRFPCGLVSEGGTFSDSDTFVASMGVNDERISLVRFRPDQLNMVYT
jgi:hypothetical protein